MIGTVGQRLVTLQPRATVRASQLFYNFQQYSLKAVHEAKPFSSHAHKNVSQLFTQRALFATPKHLFPNNVANSVTRPVSLSSKPQYSPEVLQCAIASKLAYSQKNNISIGCLQEIDIKTAHIKIKQLKPNQAKLEACLDIVKCKLFWDSSQSNYILAFRGTVDVNDWANNVKQALGFSSPEYTAAMSLAEILNSAFIEVGSTLIFTGHSLGGGLATAASTVTSCHAITFNAAGVSMETIKRYLGEGVHKAHWQLTSHDKCLVKSYELKGEILNEVQDWTFLPDANGKRIILEPAKKDIMDSALERHSMDTILAALDLPTGEYSI